MTLAYGTVDFAQKFAEFVHKDQMYTRTIPVKYMVHVNEVVNLVSIITIEDRSLDSDLITTCAYLHDTVKSSDMVDITMITKLFGNDVGSCISTITEDNNVPKFTRIRDSLQRADKLNNDLKRIVKIVKLADMLVNMSEFPQHCKLYWNDFLLLVNYNQDVTKYIIHN